MKKLLFILTVASALISQPALAQENTTTTPVVERSEPDDPTNGDPVKTPPSPMSVEENTVQPLKIYPNPAIGSDFTIDLPLAADEEVAVFIFDMNGRLLDKKSGLYSELKNIHFKSLEPATYLVSAYTRTAHFKSRVIIVH